MSAHIWIYKMQREVARRLQLYRGETHQHPNFPQGSHAANDSESPSDSAAKDIEYSPEDDEAIKQWIRENVGTAYHSISTCKMAPEEQMGVVDESLSVHGVQCLKIADLSIAPANVSGNTYSTALVIGEKAADIFIKELGL